MWHSASASAAQIRHKPCESSEMKVTMFIVIFHCWQQTVKFQTVHWLIVILRASVYGTVHLLLWERSEMKVRMFINNFHCWDNRVFWDVMLCHRASSLDVFEESYHLIPYGPTLYRRAGKAS